MSSNSTGPRTGISSEAEPFVFAPPNGAAGASHSTAQSQASDSQDEQSGYARGFADGEDRSRAAFEKNFSDLRARLAETIQQFAEQRENYFQNVESEVVQLALSIARKILHREAQIDPLLLTGIVRVALDSLNEGTQVRLLANPSETGSGSKPSLLRRRAHRMESGLLRPSQNWKGRVLDRSRSGSLGRTVQRDG